MQRPRLARARFQFVVVRWAACIVSAAFVAAGCGGSNQTNRSSSAASSATAASASAGSLLALGDSIASTANPPCQCTAFAALFAHRISARLNDQAISGTQARDLLKQLKSDDFVRQLVGKADDIVIDMGVNDLPWNRSDDPCSVLSPSGVVRWARVDESCIRGVARQFEHTMDAVLNQIDTLRTNKPTILRLTNVYNSVIGDAVDASYDSRAAVKPSEAAVARFDAIQCRLAAEHRGRCVDVDRAFNGPRGAQPAQRFLAPDHLHPNARGQEVIANLLFEAR
ncbi:MAG TPA: SGNH/GDSL hydrolase family protein [Solirubrobacteraceae bacterium]|jgi:lysophospholipase L1-like esterase